MKRAPSLLLFLVLLAGIIYLFLENQRLRDSTGPGKENQTTFYVSEGSVNPISIKLNYLRFDEATKMVGSYTDYQYKYVTEGLNRYIGRGDSLFFDARLTSFSLDTVKKLVHTMDELVKSGKLTKPDGSRITSSELGIKLYYAAYPGLRPGMPYDSLSGRHTIVLVPAYRDSKTMAYNDFYPSGEIPKKEPNSLLNNFKFRNAVKAMGFLPAPPANPEVGVNHGGACPPPASAESPE